MSRDRIGQHPLEAGGGARAAFAQSVGVEAAPRERVAHLGPVDRTLVAIARALDRLDGKHNILVLDEPTARLPQSEAAKLIARLLALKERGLPIVYVTHRLDEVYKVADAVTVLRDGRVAFSGLLSTLGSDDLRRLSPAARPERAGPLRRLMRARLTRSCSRSRTSARNG